jgi:hypothetical protein
LIPWRAKAKNDLCLGCCNLTNAKKMAT